MDEEEKGCSGLNALNPFCHGKEAIADAAGDAIDNLAAAVVEAYERSVASLGTVWVYIGTPNVTDTGGDSAIDAGEYPEVAGTNIETVLAYVTWIGFGVAIVALMALGAYMASAMKRGNGEVVMGRVGITLASVILISGASSLVAGFMPTGPEGAGGAVLFVQSSLWWFMGAAAVLSVIVAGIRMAWTQRAEPGKDLVQSVLTLIVVAGASTTVIGLLVTVADSTAIWILDSSLDCDAAESGACFADNMTALLALTTVASPALGPLLIIILGLLAILTSLVQIVLMVARGGMLVILAGILPLSASFTNTEMGKTWFKRAIGWLIAFILYKPAAAVVYAAAFQLSGTNVFQDDGSGMIAVLTGLVLMVLALFAMPALMRFVTPMVAQTSGGGGGGMAGAAAVAALPMGAAATGRLMGMFGGGGSDSGPSSSSSSAPSGSSETGPSGPSGDSSAGGQGPGGSGNSSTGAEGSSGPGGATEDAGGSRGSGKTGAGTAGADGAAGSGTGASAGTGAVSGAGAGAGAGAAGGAAGGGAAAAGAAGGPVGMAAGAAVDAGTKAGKAAAGAAKSVGEEATGEEGGGPSGSR